MVFIKDIIEFVKVRQILNSRGDPTVEIELHTTVGVFRSSSPSGASAGTHEVKVILDSTTSYCGKSVERAMFNIKKIIVPRLYELELKPDDIKGIDEFLKDLDGTSDLSRLGSNAILPLSMSFCRLGAVYNDMSLRKFISTISNSTKRIPVPHFNVINGGLHAKNGLVFQEIMISFHDTSYLESLEKSCMFYYKLKKIIGDRYGTVGVGDEGGFAPDIKSIEEGLDLIMEVANSCDNIDTFKIAIDCAANEFYNGDKYYIDRSSKKALTGCELAHYYLDLLDKYPLLYSLEDPFAEDDIDSWALLREMLSGRSTINIVGDDLTVTNVERLQFAIDNGLINTLLVKPNQIGTVSETLKAVELAKKAGLKVMVSHRSGETEDTFIADLSAGIGADYIKSGAPARGERVSKYNQLIRIDELNVPD